MNTIKKGFSISELVIALMIMAILSTLTIVSMGNKIDKNKAMFKKAYSTIEKASVELIYDETLYPYDADPNNFGLWEPSNVRIPGTDACVKGSYTNVGCNQTLAANDEDRLLKFCTLLTNSLNVSEEKWEPDSSQSDDIKEKCNFITTDNIGWHIKVGEMSSKFLSEEEELAGTINKNKHKGFLITIDTNNSKDPNKPKEYSDVKQPSGTYESDLNMNNRDRFFILIRKDGKIIIPQNDKKIQDYIRASDFGQEK